jgi:hypothetical protein
MNCISHYVDDKMRTTNAFLISLFFHVIFVGLFLHFCILHWLYNEPEDYSYIEVKYNPIVNQRPTIKLTHRVDVPYKVDYSISSRLDSLGIRVATYEPIDTTPLLPKSDAASVKTDALDTATLISDVLPLPGIKSILAGGKAGGGGKAGSSGNMGSKHQVGIVMKTYSPDLKPINIYQASQPANIMNLEMVEASSPALSSPTMSDVLTELVWQMVKGKEKFVDVLILLDISRSMKNDAESLALNLEKVFSLFRRTDKDYEFHLVESRLTNTLEVIVHRHLKLNEIHYLLTNTLYYGDELMRDALARILEYSLFRRKSQRHIILVTDEQLKGQHSLQYLVQRCQNNRVKVHVLGILDREQCLLSSQTGGGWYAVLSPVK